jgi:glycosyltransferase involved in cell wall biosynthesis
VLENADICVNAQKSKEGFGDFSFPSKLFEYLSEHKIVVSSDVADVREALADTVIIYEDDKPEKLASALEEAIQIAESPDEYQKMMQKIEDFIEQNSLEQTAAKIDKMLAEILKEKKNDTF